ncbi:toxin-antitoxin system YwqK family antitoxin [Tenacibaculum agarivorans]|uniref:toxin-antitoxin system YwqK family antitoxin n=1 Tax=Tenacibaculum agarivorans TaxID=1908389 RepID=UPI00094BC08E|nr:hypothetical protein [Tenacibaculum agarivorans]
MNSRGIFFFSIFYFIYINCNGQQWVNVLTTKFGKQTLYRDADDKALNGHYKIATSYDGRYSEINVKEGKLEGERKDFNKDGALVKVEYYKEGFLYGVVKDYYVNGKVKKETTYEKGTLNGVVKGYDFNGNEVSTEHYENGLKVGKWVARIRKVSTSEYYTVTKFFTKGKPSGTWKEVNEENTPVWIKKYFSSNHYRKREYYDNGQLKKEITQKEGKTVGDKIEYYNTGTLKSKWTYKEGKLKYRLDNNEDGNPKFIGHYKKGKLHGEHIHYDDNGQITMKGNFLDGRRNGVWEFNVTSKRITTYKNGKKHGLEKIYSSDGKLFSEGSYANNIKNGVWKYYNKNQDVTRETNYKRGKQEYEKKY